jgi:hypothetical protein
VFGRLNLIDALAAGVVLVAIPLVYWAFLLFRVPLPTIDAVAPARVIEFQPTTIRITGTNLRPYLDAWIGNARSEGYLVQSPVSAEIKLPRLAPGVYDIALYDDARELVRKVGALAVGPQVPAGVVIRVRFMAAPEVLTQMKIGDKDVLGEGGKSLPTLPTADRAVLTDLGTDRQTVAASEWVSDSILNRYYQVPQSLVAFTGIVHVPVVSTPAGLAYKDRPVKVGAPFFFESRTAEMFGWILDVQPATSATASK